MRQRINVPEGIDMRQQGVQAPQPGVHPDGPLHLALGAASPSRFEDDPAQPSDRR
jgi:hypothetical protein